MSGEGRLYFLDNLRTFLIFLVFLLGSLCFRLRVFDTEKRNMKLYIAVNATAWIPINIYLITVLNYFLRPGQFLVSERADPFLLWFGFYLSMLSLIYCAVATFKYFFNRRGPVGSRLGRLSYGVYIIHMAVLGPIAFFLLEIDIAGLWKYPILTLAAYAVSNFIVYAYKQAKDRPALAFSAAK